MSYTTIYMRTVKRRSTGRTETFGCAYTTKALTAMHASIRSRHPEAVTYKDPKRVITDFVPGMNLGMLPIVSGGERVAP